MDELRASLRAAYDVVKELANRQEAHSRHFSKHNAFLMAYLAQSYED